MISRNLVTVPNSPPQPTKVLGVTFPSSVFLCTLCAFSVHYTVYNTDYLITHYTSYDHYGREQQLTNWRSDHSGKVCLPEGYYRLTGQCENTISSAFKKLQSNNPLLLLNLNKFWRLAEGGKRDSWGVIALPPLATALPNTRSVSKRNTKFRVVHSNSNLWFCYYIIWCVSCILLYLQVAYSNAWIKLRRRMLPRAGVSFNFTDVLLSFLS